MRKLRGFIPTTTLAFVLLFGSTFANAGIIVWDLKGTPTRTTQQCTDKNDTKTDWGIIIQGVTGIIIQGLTGIIIQGVSDTEAPTNCGIIIQG
ncbi:hypothetical protein [Leptolyngbya sp. 7M]|uniref:hypothetical protein n=1 Tax=Leptolyngbya sp. 7M TaxID=2812896 RepID=UPI001B8C64AB|nr:hypothetical protein [Leptolyngbya sp. 7M]QYO66843.1 hypothetical protein JVX88_08580 [Leptolyngbya sp. 7M]